MKKLEYNIFLYMIFIILCVVVCLFLILVFKVMGYNFDVMIVLGLEDEFLVYCFRLWGFFVVLVY